MYFSQSRVIFSLIIFLGCIQAALNPLRLLSIFNMAYINLFIIYAIGAMSLFFFFIKNKILSTTELLLFVFLGVDLIYSLAVANDSFSVFTGLIRPLFFIAIIKIFSTVSLDERNEYFPSIRSVKWLLFSYIIGVSVTAYVYLFIGGIRASASAIPLALPLFYYLMNKKYFKVLLVFSLFLLGGKFGPLMGVLLAFYFMFFFKLKKLFVSLVFVGLVSTVLMVLVSYNYIDLSKIPVLAKLNTHQLAEQGWELDLFDKVILGERLSEGLSALNGLSEKNQLETYIFGGGLGYTYLWESISGYIIRDENRGVHFTPLAVFVEYGLPFTLLIFLYLFKYLFKSIKILINYANNEKNIVIWSAFFLASFFNMITAYSLFTNLLLAVSIGFLQNISRKNYGK